MGQVHNEIRRYTRLLQAARRALGEEARGAWGVERFGETLTPILDLWSRPEWSALYGEALWWTNIASPAVALQNSFGAIFSAAGSGLLVTIEGWYSLNATDLFVGSHPQATIIAGTLATVDARDRRFGSSQVGFARRSVGAEAVATQTISLGAGALAGVVYPIHAVIAPGTNVSWQRQTVNAAFTLNVWGRVRKAQPGELAGPQFVL